MKRVLEFKNPVMDWEDMEITIKIIPELKDSFQKHKYDFLYNNFKELELNIEQIEELSEYFEISINGSYIKIMN